MSDDIDFVDPVFLFELEDFLFEDFRVVLNRGKRLNLAPRDLVALDFEDALNLTKRLHENAVPDRKTMNKDDRITRVHRFDDSIFVEGE